MTREEHLQWCKDRALEYVEKGELQGAFALMALNMGKHPETECPKTMALGLQLLMGGHLDTVDKMDKWINGFN